MTHAFAHRRLTNGKMGTPSLLTGVVTLGLVLSVVLAAGPAAATVSFTNPLATPSTTDLDITSLDVDYGTSRIQVTAHVQNLNYGDSDFLLYLTKAAETTKLGPGDLYLGAYDLDSEVAYTATYGTSGSSVPAPTSSLLLSQDTAAGTVTLSADSSLLTGAPVYVVAELVSNAASSNAPYAEAAVSDTSAGLTGFGPIQQDGVVVTTPPATAAPATKTVTRLTVSKNRQTYDKARTRIMFEVSPAASGKVVLYDRKKKLKTLRLVKGKAHYKLSKNLKKGTHKLKATFVPANPAAFAASTSKTVKLRVLER